MKKVYIIGSLRNPEVPELAKQIRELGFEVFDDWHGTGPEADDYWQKYEENRGRPYHEALYGYAATNTFEFDKSHIDAADIGILLLPAGKSGHLEIGYMTGQGKRTYILFNDTPERWDVMYRFVNRVYLYREDLFQELAILTQPEDAPRNLQAEHEKFQHIRLIADCPNCRLLQATEVPV